jgi:hypothetical protein
MPKRISYMVSSIEVVKLLLWNTGNITHIAEFHIANIWNRKQNSDGIWFLPTRKCRTWTKMAWRRCSDCSAMNHKYKCTQNFQDDWRILNHEGFLSASPLDSTSPSTWISRERCMILKDFNHGYKFCLIFCLRMRRKLPVMVLSTRVNRTLV